MASTTKLLREDLGAETNGEERGWKSFRRRWKLFGTARVLERGHGAGGKEAMGAKRLEEMTLGFEETMEETEQAIATELPLPLSRAASGSGSAAKIGGATIVVNRCHERFSS